MNKKLTLGLTRKAVLTAVAAITLGLVSSISAQTAREIASIQSEVAAINKRLPRYTKSTKDVDDVSTEGTQATYYRSGERLKKVTAKIYGETFKAAGEFYYGDGPLIFAFLRISRYNGQIGMSTPLTVRRIEQYRYYLVNGELSRIMSGKKILKPGSDKYIELKDQLDGIVSKF